MLVIEETEQSEKILTLNERRAHLKLPLEERRRQLAAQAEKLTEHYKESFRDREQWQGGDIIEF